MMRLTLGLLIGIGLGAAVSTHAQSPKSPCGWVLWKQTDADKTWEPFNGYADYDSCLTGALRFTRNKDLSKYSFSCYSDTFDPRPR
jgi:hypothetical protein